MWEQSAGVRSWRWNLGLLRARYDPGTITLRRCEPLSTSNKDILARAIGFRIPINPPKKCANEIIDHRSMIRPADNAGIVPGDIVLEFAGKTTSNIKELVEEI